MKIAVLLLMLLSIFLIGYYTTVLFTGSASQRSSAPTSLQLIDLPATYCPKSADVVLSRDQKLVKEATLVVADCRTLSLQSLLNGQSEPLQVSVKLPSALAFRLSWPADGLFQYAPALGDVNNDNSINGTDSDLVQQNLFVTNPTNSSDIDRDGQVTVNDLAIARLHQGVGVDRPDGKPWSS